MSTWFVLLSLLIIPRPDVVNDGVSEQQPEQMRYRGIEQLLAKFEAESAPAQ